MVIFEDVVGGFVLYCNMLKCLSNIFFPFMTVQNMRNTSEYDVNISFMKFIEWQVYCTEQSINYL